MFILRRLDSLNTTPVDLGVLGVNTPNRSRESRIVTHNLNSLGFANIFTGRSPVSWQMSGEFVTNGGPRLDRTGGTTRRTALQHWRVLDQWAREGRDVRIEQYDSSRNLGVAKIRQLSETGSVMDGQTLSTKWQLTLLFQDLAGNPAVELVGASPIIGGGAGGPGTGGPGTGGTGPGGPGPPGPGPGGPTTRPTPPPIPGTTVPPPSGKLRLAVLTVPPDHRGSMSPYGVNGVFVEIDKLRPGSLVPSPLVSTTLIVDTLSTPGIPGSGFGHWLWLEIWDGTGNNWEPFDQANPWIWRPDTTDNPLTRVRYNLGEGDEFTFWWLRVRQSVGGTDTTPNDDTQDPDPGGRSGQNYQNADVSDPFVIYWGSYTNQEIPVPPGVGAPNQPMPNRPPARAVIHAYSLYRRGHDNYDEDDPPARATERNVYPLVYQIPYGSFEVITVQLVIASLVDQMNIASYDVTIQRWDGSAWVDQDGEGYWQPPGGLQRQRSLGTSATLTGATQLTRTWERSVTPVPDNAMEAGNHIDWFRARYTQGTDVFFTPRVAFVYPSYGGNYQPRPLRYDLDPDP